MNWDVVKGKIGVFVRNNQRALTIFAVIIAVILIFGGYMLYLVSVETTSGTKQKRHLAAVEEAREGLRDDEKTPLTSDFLAEEYKIYVKGENRFALLSLVAFTLLACALCGTMIFVLVKVIRGGKLGQDYDVFTLMRTIFCIVAFLVLAFFLSSTAIEAIKEKVNGNRPDITVRAIEIVKKESGSKEYTDSEGKKRGRNYYYLRCENDGAPQTIEVSFEIYNQVMDPGPYFLAYIDKSTGDDFVGIYPAEEYAWPA